MDRQLSIAGKLLVLQVSKALCKQLSLSDLKYNSHYKPYFDDALNFNITHSGNMAVCCGTENGQIGIDAEEVKDIDLADYTDYFTPNEWKQINNYPNKYDGFYDFWTRKEAVLKAIGTGFHTPLSSVDVSDESLIYDDIRYHLKTLSIGKGYKCHIAATQIPDKIQLIKVSL